MRRSVIVHRFGSLDAKQEQRYDVGNGARQSVGTEFRTPPAAR